MLAFAAPRAFLTSSLFPIGLDRPPPISLMSRHTLSRLLAFVALASPASALQVTQEAYLKPGTSCARGDFGIAVDIDGNTLVVGSPDADGGRGKATVFVRIGGSWTFQQELTALGLDNLSSFGEDVAIDGNTIAIGAPGFGSISNGTLLKGAVFVFERLGSSWTTPTTVTATNGGQTDMFGGAVDLHGGTLVVGASLESSNATGVDGNEFDNSASASGAAYVFRGGGGFWTQEAYLKASNTGGSDGFGTSVSVSGDTVAVGASGEDSDANGVGGDGSNNDANSAGACYVYRKSGVAWQFEAYLKATNSDPGDQFGTSVSISGNTLVCGAPFEQSIATGVGGDQSNNDAAGPGAAYVFTRSGTTWSSQAYIKAATTDLVTDDQFGTAVALENGVLVIGGPTEWSNATGIGGDQTNNGANRSGAVLVFQGSGSSWSQLEYVKASNTDGLDFFGLDVAISQGTAVVGAPFEDSNALEVGGDQADNSLDNPGAAYVFDLDTGSCPTPTVTSRTAGTNVASFTADPMVIGTNWTATVDLGVTGHASAQVLGFQSAVNLPLGGGQVILVGGPRVFKTPLQAGPLASWTIGVPNDNALVGLTLYAQAVHIGGVTPFLLTNTQDLLISCP